MPKTAKELKKLLANDDVAIESALAGLSEKEISSLFDMEIEGQQRDAVLELIQAAAAAAVKGKLNAGGGFAGATSMLRDPPDGGVGTKDDDKKARGEEIPAWQKPDYNGPMTVEIANWRNANLK